MERIGLFYGTRTVRNTTIARKIKKAFGEIPLKVVSVEEVWQRELEAFETLIIGASTWFDGELPTYWDEIIPELTRLDLQGKRVAIFGLGDQVRYTDNFVDGIGILAEAVECTGATLVGLCSPEGYCFNQSRALRQGKMLGLPIDLENQANLTDARIQAWVEQIKGESA